MVQEIDGHPGTYLGGNLAGSVQSELFLAKLKPALLKFWEKALRLFTKRAPRADKSFEVCSRPDARGRCLCSCPKTKADYKIDLRDPKSQGIRHFSFRLKATRMIPRSDKLEP